MTSVEAQPGCSGDELLMLAAAAERNTRHPLADALVAAAESRGAACTDFVLLASRLMMLCLAKLLPAPPSASHRFIDNRAHATLLPPCAGMEVPLASSSQTEPGEGVWAQIGDRHVAVGRREWVQQRCAADPAASEAAVVTASSSSSSRESSSSSDTEVWVGWSGQGLAGRLLLSDTPRPDAAGVVARLQQAGLRVLLLSGDRQEAVQAMAAAAGIHPGDAYSGVRPEEKAAVVQRLRAEGRQVAMVGDGVNDAPALASANVGIAMGGGTAVAGDAAGVVLLGDRLGQVRMAGHAFAPCTCSMRAMVPWRQQQCWPALGCLLSVCLLPCCTDKPTNLPANPTVTCHQHCQSICRWMRRWCWGAPPWPRSARTWHGQVRTPRAALPRACVHCSWLVCAACAPWWLVVAPWLVTLF